MRGIKCIKRHFDCEYYDDCLMYACIRNVKTFTCNYCMLCTDGESIDLTDIPENISDEELKKYDL